MRVFTSISMVYLVNRVRPLALFIHSCPILGQSIRAVTSQVSHLALIKLIMLWGHILCPSLQPLTFLPFPVSWSPHKPAHLPPINPSVYIQYTGLSPVAIFARLSIVSYIALLTLFCSVPSTCLFMFSVCFWFLPASLLDSVAERLPPPQSSAFESTTRSPETSQIVLTCWKPDWMAKDPEHPEQVVKMKEHQLFQLLSVPNICNSHTVHLIWI